MHVITKNLSSVNKTNENLFAVVRNASWDKGWLRTFMQAFFCIITVASFVLILYMAFGSSSTSSTSRCEVQGCRVYCTEAPYFDLFEDDIVFTVTETALTCTRIVLSLKHPMFSNNTLPHRWLSSLSPVVYDLEIIGGNLQYIAPQAFLSRFTRYIRRLSFEFISLMEWKQETLVGFVDLQELGFKSCNFFRIDRNALQAVDDTLETLFITSSGFWDPVNVTGSSQFDKLSNVLFSSNNFYNILRRESFTQLSCSTTLFLDSCRIHAIGPGTFDSLINIQMLHLSNNFLMVLPAGLFDRILTVVSPRPRINLQGNRWLCDCSSSELKRLSNAGMLLFDPVCYYPITYRGEPFTKFLESCDRNVIKQEDAQSTNENSVQSVYMDVYCQINETLGNIAIISPLERLPCHLDRDPENLFKMHQSDRNRKRPKSNDLLQTSFAMKSDDFSLLEVTSSGSEKYGLIWYQMKCTQEIYCVTSIPNYLRVYNIDKNAEYTFCPWILHSGSVDHNNCVYYKVEIPDRMVALKITLYAITGVLGFSSGALIIYLIIRKYPNLLRGSSRILFVKHKNVDALILPPKVPLRSSLINSEPITEFNNNNIFLLPDTGGRGFARSKSVRSSKSTAPSYISALQPTAEQLTEWRLRHHFDNDMTVTSMFDSMAPVYEDDRISFYSLNPLNSRIYESLK